MTVSKPAIGDLNWGVTLNAALDSLDANITSVTSSDATKAPLASPTFTGTVVLPSTTSIGNVSSTEIGYVDGVTSAIQSQLDSKLASSTAASTYLTSATAASTYATITNDNLKAPLASPTFTGTVVLPSTTSIGTTTSTELGYVHGVTSAIQTQLNAMLTSASASSTYATIANDNLKATIASPTFTGTVSAPVISTTQYQTYAVAAVTTPITASTYTVPVTDTFIIFNSASAISVTLPTASSFTGRVLNLKTISTGAVTSASSNVVPLATTTAASTLFSANSAGKWTTLVSNGTNWVIMAQN